jgi:3',5'-cyclic-AMP phosphodiesterase
LLSFDTGTNQLGLLVGQGFSLLQRSFHVMIKWINRIITVVILSISGLTLAHSESNTPVPEQIQPEQMVSNKETQATQTIDHQPILQIPILSDVHIGREQGDVPEAADTRYIKALLDYQEIAPQMDAFIVVGDMTDLGKKSEYDQFNAITNQYIDSKIQRLYTIGNHEFLESGLLSLTSGNTLTSRFIEKTSSPNVYYDSWIKDYHFIVLGGELSANKLAGRNDNDAYLSEEQLQWFKQKLAEGAVSNKPIFVFLHQPLNNTLSASADWGAGEISSQLKEILEEYPQVILFSGHTHFPLQEEQSVVTDGFTMVNTGAVAYIEGQLHLSQGLLLNVYSDRVEIKAREFSTKEWIKTINIPVQ